ncbi:hypothetical protein PsYK624_166210 [Phanerochaete sordida]|uniref:Uncharacterized protein n=1 Tax=Phanerochaete sordida TaxID=48140 RepID=A0A9P3GWU4_9APHY|nr:hypothetical protein PsYK624_166210 [Phanerochaete sordida]
MATKSSPATGYIAPEAPAPRPPRTKQTARKSTGGRLPRKVLADMAARGQFASDSSDPPRLTIGTVFVTQRDGVNSVNQMGSGLALQLGSGSSNTGTTVGELTGLCDIVEDSQTMAQMHLDVLHEKILDFHAQQEVTKAELRLARAELALAHTKNKELRGDNEKLHEANVALRAENAALRRRK